MGDKELSGYINSIVPIGVEKQTIGDLLASDDTDISIKKGILIAKKDFGDQHMSLRIEKKRGFTETAYTAVDGNLSRHEQTKLAKELRKEGRTQTEIADIMGLSQPYISQLLKKQ